MRSTATALLTAALSAGIVGLTADAAHADPPPHPICTFVTTASGAGELSKLLCNRPDRPDESSSDYAEWDDSWTLTDPGSGGTVADLAGTYDVVDPATGAVDGGYTFQFDPALVDLASFQKELKDQFGFTNVTLYSGYCETSGVCDPSEVAYVDADFVTKSKAKH